MADANSAPTRASGLLLDIPAPEITDPHVIGTRCDPAQMSRQLFNRPMHEGCPGWWGQHAGDPHAIACACPCHAETHGWPHWEEAYRKSFAPPTLTLV